MAPCGFISLHFKATPSLNMRRFAWTDTVRRIGSIDKLRAHGAWRRSPTLMKTYSAATVPPMSSSTSSQARQTESRAANWWLRQVRHLLETAAFFSIIGFFRLFSLDQASAIGGWIGRNLVAPTR